MTKTNIQRRLVNILFTGATSACAIAAIATLVLILGQLLHNGILHLSWSSLTELPMPVGEAGGGMANAIMGTVMMVGIAAAIGIPVGILGGICLSSPGRARLGSWLRAMVDVLSGTPSIVIGVFVYLVIVVPFGQFSALAGGAALGIMMIPAVMRSTGEALERVPHDLREASLALGVPQWRTVLSVVATAGRTGIMTGVLLAVARVAGETAPLLFTAFGNRFWNTQVSQPMAALPLQIYAYAVSPYDDWQAQAWAAALVLITLILVLNAMARLILWRT